MNRWQRYRNTLRIFMFSFLALTYSKPYVENYFDRRELEKSNYGAVYKGSVFSLYAFDDNNNNEVDRIEEIGVTKPVQIPNFVNTFSIKRTHLPSDRDYDFYSDELYEHGHIRDGRFKNLYIRFRP